MPISLMNSLQAALCGSALSQGRSPERDSGHPADWCCLTGAGAERPSRHSGREAEAAGRKESCGGKKGQTLKLPGCCLRARMLSVLSTSWQQQHGPGRRRRCGNGAARVAEPAFAPACSPREALPTLPSTPRPLRGRERVKGAGSPAREAPRRGAARELEAARAGSGAAPRRGGLARTRLGGGRGALRATRGATGPASPWTSRGGRADTPRHRPSPGNAPCPLPFPRPGPRTPPAASPPRGGLLAAAAAAAGNEREAGGCAGRASAVP